MSRGRNGFNKEEEIDLTLRPRTWKDYVGQEKTKKNLMIMLSAAKQRGEMPEHILFFGYAGLGKTTLSYLVAQEIGAEIRVTSGPAIKKAGDLAGILTNLPPRSVLFVDEIHRLPKVIEEYLYPALEDFKLNLLLGTGPMAKTMELAVPRFTLIGATTQLASVSSPLRSRFGATFGLLFYSEEEIRKILEKSARILGVEAEDKALKIIAHSSRATPRVANHLLKRVRDFAQVEGRGRIDGDTAERALRMLDIDGIGLTRNDRRLLETIITKFGGGPVGLQALAASLNEEEETILNIYEPYLMQLGFIKRTPRGRSVAPAAYNHLRRSPLSQNSALL